MFRTLGFLEFRFAGGDISVQSVLMLLVLLLTYTLSLIPLFTSGPPRSPLLLLLHAIALAFLEQTLLEQGSDFYSAPLVLLSSVCGVMLTARLEERKRFVDSPWAVYTMHTAKLALLLGPFPFLLPSSFALTTLTLSAWWLTPLVKLRGAQPWLVAAFCALMSWLLRGTLPARALQLASGFPPSQAALSAAFLFVWGASLLPLAYRYSSQLKLLRALAVLLLTAGFCLALLQPEFHVQLAEELLSPDGHQVRGSVRWLLFAAIACSVAAVSGVLPLSTNEPLRLTFSASLGASFAIFCVAAYMPKPTPIALFAAVGLLFAAAAVLLATLLRESPIIAAPHAPLLYAAITASSAVTALYVRRLYHSLPDDERRAAWLAWLALCAGFNLLIAACTKLRLANEALPAAPVKTRFGYVTRNSEHVRASLALLGNIATLLGFALPLYLSVHYLDGHEMSVFVFSPVLLLLNNERHLFAQLNDENRYFPLVLCSSIALVASALYTLFGHSALVQLGLVQLGTMRVPPTAFFMALQSTLLLIAMPSVFRFNTFLITRQKQNQVAWLTIAPLTVLPLLFAEYDSTRLLAAIGGFGSLYQFVVQRQTKRTGQDIL